MRRHLARMGPTERASSIANIRQFNAGMADMWERIDDTL